MRQPLFVRLGEDKPFEFEDGVPKHIRTGVIDWLRAVARKAPHPTEFVTSIARSQHVSVKVGEWHNRLIDLIGACLLDERLYLSVLDEVLHQAAPWSRPDDLEDILESGHSLWRVNATRDGLERRVGSESLELYNAVQSSGGPAATNLSEAWKQTYGTSPNPSDAWHHSIKAVEAALIPLVTPKATKATLGTALGDLRQAPVGKWSFALPGPDLDNTIAPLISVLEMIWPNPDRHEGGHKNRQPTLKEAETVVQLATTVVQWINSGALERAK